MWGEELNSIDDVNEVFSCFISGKKNSQGAKVLFVCLFVYAMSRCLFTFFR